MHSSNYNNNSSSNSDEFWTLNELNQRNKKNAHIVGIILDCAASYKTTNDYLTRIKIIDDTFNSYETPNLVRDYFEVYHFSDQAKCPQVHKIGDIIYLRKYNVSAADERRLQIETNRKAKCSYFIFDSEHNNYDVIDTDYDGSAQEYPLSPFLKERVKQLRSYTFSLFSTRSLLSMCWFGLQTQEQSSMQEENKQFNKKDFDLLLSIQSINQDADIPSQVRLSLVDSENRQYTFSFANRSFKQGQIVKIRSIRFIEQDGLIVKNDYSNVLKLSNFFYDFKNFKEIKCDLTEYHEKNHGFDSHLNDINDPLRRFTLLKRIHQHNTTFTNLSELLKVQADPTLFAGIRTQKLKLQVYLVDVYPRDLRQAVKKVSYLQQNTSVALTEAETFEKTEGLNRIMELQLAVKDESIDLKPEIVQLVLVQEEKEKNHDFFAGVELLNVNSENVQAYQQVFESTINRLIEHSTIARPIELAVQPILFNDRVLFRVIDTQFLA